MIAPEERRLIEMLKESLQIRIEMVNKETTLSVWGDKIFAHDIALAYQSFVLRKNKGK